MKKIFIFTFTALIVLTISCSKNDSLFNTEKSTRVTIKGSIPEQATTKTDYTIDWENHKATFCWKGTEVFKALGWTASSGAEGGYLYGYQYTGTADSAGETVIDFTGGTAINDSGFALYPWMDGASGATLNWSSGANPLRLYLYESIPYDYNNPIKGVVPMIGKLNAGRTEYEFVPITGILAIRMTNIPAEATKLTISSPNTVDGGFSKDFAIDDHVANYAAAIQNVYENGLAFTSTTAGSKLSTKSYTFSNLNSASTYYFYFPTPVGDLSGLQIELCDATGTFYTVTSSKAVTSTRGTITRLPLITVPTAPSATITGDLNNRTAIFEKNGAEKIKYGIATSSSTKLSEISSTTTASTSVAVAPGATGTYYLVYQGYKDDETTKVGPEKRVQFLYSTSNVSQIAGTYKINNNNYFKLKIDAVDPAQDGKNIEITTYYSNNSNYNEAAGHCYGIYTPQTGTITIASGQTLTKNTTTYYLVAINNNTFSSPNGTYKDNFVFTLKEVDNNAAIRFNSPDGRTDGLCVATSITPANKSFVSGGQHFTSDGQGGPFYLYKSN